MIEFVRRRKKGLINFILLTLCVILMVGFGIDSLKLGKTRKETAITVNGEEISRYEFDHNLRSMELLYQRQLQGAFDQIRASLNLPQKIADQMVDEHLLAHFFDSLGLTASVPQVEERVAQLPYFEGKVDKESFNSYLKGTGLTEAALESSIRKEVVEGELQNTLAQLSSLTTAELKASYQRENEQAKFIAAKLSAAAFTPKVNVTPEELHKFYDEHKTEFVDPKSANVEYIRLTPKSFEGQVEVRDEDLHQMYEEKKSQLVEEEQILLSKISLSLAAEPAKSEEEKTEQSSLSPNDKKRQLAQSIIDRAKKGESFEALARSLSEDTETKDKGGDLGWKKVTDLKDNIRTEIDGVKPGELSGIIEDGPELSLYFVRERKPKHELSFDEVREKLAAQLREDDAPLYLESGADALYAKLQDGKETLEQAGKTGGYEYKTENDVGAHTRDLPPDFVKSVGDSEVETIEKAEAAKEIFIYRVLKIKPEGTLPFEKVEDKIRKHLTDTGAKGLMNSAAQELAKNAGTSIEEFKTAAKNAGAEIVETELKPRAELKAEFIDSPDRANQLFQLVSASEPISKGTNSYVVRLVEKKPADMEKFDQEKAKLLAEESRTSGQRLLDTIVSTLKAESDIVINPEILQTTES